MRVIVTFLSPSLPKCHDSTHIPFKNKPNLPKMSRLHAYIGPNPGFHAQITHKYAHFPWISRAILLFHAWGLGQSPNNTSITSEDFAKLFPKVCTLLHQQKEKQLFCFFSQKKLHDLKAQKHKSTHIQWHSARSRTPRATNFH
jgi:hypothetical protein